MNSFESFDQNAVVVKEIDIKEKLSELNKQFPTKISPENGIYGIKEVLKDDGTLERIVKSEGGHTIKEYYREGKLFLTRENLGGGRNVTTEYDDSIRPYYRKTVELGENVVKESLEELIPNNTIKKGNFTAVIDAYGRPVLNKATNLSLNEAKRKGLAQFKDSFYRAKDDAGHLIAHMFGGPDSKENIVPQLDTVNRSNMKRVELIVKDLVLEGHTVDYEMKVNYIGADKRPTSFEPTILVDGKEYLDLPKELKKIYNTLDPSSLDKVITTAGERFSLAHQISARSGLEATKLTFAVSAADNIAAFLSGDISVEEMTLDIIKDTAVAGALGYGSTFIDSTASQALSRSSIALLRNVGGTCLPASVVSFAVESYDAVSQFSRGEIDGMELLYELGDSAASVAGGLGGMKGGAAVGTLVAGPPGTVVGGIAGGLIGCVVSSEAYAVAVEAGSEFVVASAEQAEVFFRETLSYVEEYAPEKIADVKQAFDVFIEENHLPFHI